MFSAANFCRRNPFAGVVLALVAIVCLIPLCSGRAIAQNVDAAQIAATLEPQSQTVIARLSSLSELPDGDWKMHAGDIAHGESLNLDESTWQIIKP
ncbi:MAG: hypothetical protein WCA11_10960, partial [Terracidiphilus sp.]